MQREYNFNAGIPLVQIRFLGLVSFRFDWIFLPTFLVLDGLVSPWVPYLLATKAALRRTTKCTVDDCRLEWKVIGLGIGQIVSWRGWRAEHERLHIWLLFKHLFWQSCECPQNRWTTARNNRWEQVEEMVEQIASQENQWSMLLSSPWFLQWSVLCKFQLARSFVWSSAYSTPK